MSSPLTFFPSPLTQPPHDAALRDPRPARAGAPLDDGPRTGALQYAPLARLSSSLRRPRRPAPQTVSNLFLYYFALAI